MKYHKTIIIAGLATLALTGCGKADSASAENWESLEKTDTEETETIQETQEQLPEFQKREFTIEDPEYDFYTREGQQELTGTESNSRNYRINPTTFPMQTPGFRKMTCFFR